MKAETKTLSTSINEKPAFLTVTPTPEVDLASYAYQIWEKRHRTNFPNSRPPSKDCRRWFIRPSRLYLRKRSRPAFSFISVLPRQ